MGVIVSDRRTLVVGLGKTGLSCVRYLCEKGRDVAVADSRLSPPEKPAAEPSAAQ